MTMTVMKSYVICKEYLLFITMMIESHPQTYTANFNSHSIVNAISKVVKKIMNLRVNKHYMDMDFIQFIQKYI